MIYIEKSILKPLSRVFSHKSANRQKKKKKKGRSLLHIRLRRDVDAEELWKKREEERRGSQLFSVLSDHGGTSDEEKRHERRWRRS